ncbi:MAG: serine hydrolase [Bacteroidota bacterium]
MVKKLWLPTGLIILCSFVSSCTFVRFFVWNYADINDQYKFPSVPIHAVSSGTFHFMQGQKNLVIQQIPGTRDVPFSQILSDNMTTAFLIIRNDSIVYETYDEGIKQSDYLPSFSVSKSFVATLAGIAIGEGKIPDTKQVVTDYLPWMTKPGFEKITMEDLLNMRSGLDFEESYRSPFSLMPKYYYGRNMKRYLKQLKVAGPPDKTYVYQSVNSLILGLMIQQAVGKPLNQYLEEKLWSPMGMESDASWSTDNKNTIKYFCCINAVARDYARFGRLYLNKGEWNGKQLVPKAWMERTMSVVNDSRDGEGFGYTYCWRVTPKGAIFAKGILGQYIYVYPKKKVIIVRLGKKNGISWGKLCEKLVDQL